MIVSVYINFASKSEVWVLKDIETLSDTMVEEFIEAHKGYSNEELIQMYGKRKLFIINIFIDAKRKRMSPQLLLFDVLLEAYHNGGPKEIVERLPNLISIAIQEFKEYGNPDPLARLIEQGVQEVFENSEALEIIAAKTRDGLEDRRGKRKNSKRENDERNRIILALLTYYQGLGFPVWGESRYKTNACEKVHEALKDIGFEKPLSPESIYKNIWKPNQKDDQSSFVSFYEAGLEDKKSGGYK
jgi:hypothetical protein